jgi:hypothetical protein
MPKKAERSSSASTGSRVIGRDDTGRFKEASKEWVSANTVTQSAARGKLRELGFIDQSGRPTKPYK